MTPDRMKICLLEPWYGGSHRRWADGLRKHSAHAVTIFPLPARHWKWRMHGAAVTFAEQLNRLPPDWDLILASDMMDVALFRSLLADPWRRIPLATYFHENQLTYPVSPRDTDKPAQRDRHYGFVNYTSVLASDRVYFNSHYHMKAFLGALPGFLEGFPDFPNRGTVQAAAEKSAVLPLGMELHALGEGKPADPQPGRVPLLLWNHRWEYDKQPEAFLQLLLALLDKGLDFEVALLGERGSREPDLLPAVRTRLGDRIVHDGMVGNRAEYAAWLWRADILPVTAQHDFFGGSVVEAVYCGCHPLLPNDLAYPEHFTDGDVFYTGIGEGSAKLQHLIRSGLWREHCPLSAEAARYDWERMAPVCDEAFHRLAAEGTSSAIPE